MCKVGGLFRSSQSFWTERGRQGALQIYWSDQVEPKSKKANSRANNQVLYTWKLGMVAGVSSDKVGRT